jgi:transposase InsO family protein
VEVIKQFLTDKQYAHWGIKSTWALAFKQKLTALAPGSWYRYNRRFRFKTRLEKGKKPKYTSVIAQCVNEIWHADITQIKTKDGTRWYLYTIMDNFSRFHHVWQLEKVVSAQIRTETIKSAIQKVFPTNPDQNLRLITDGGPENDNITVRQFLDQCAVSVNHQIALKDIEQSNSMMERFYHTAKYSYLYRLDLTDENIHQKVEEMYHEYHHAKPHYALGIYTPFEVLNGADKHACFAEIYTQAAQKRREANRNTKCEQEC